MVDTNCNSPHLDDELDSLHIEDFETLHADDIKPCEFLVYCQNLSTGLSSAKAAADIGRTSEGIRKWLKRNPQFVGTADRARIRWEKHHLGTLHNPGDGKGSGARVRGALGALASVDRRYRKPRAIVGGQVNVNLTLPDMRPAALIQGGLGDPGQYALPESVAPGLPAPEAAGILDAVVEGTTNAKKLEGRPKAGVRRRRAKAKGRAKKKKVGKAGPAPGPAPIL